jgi:hypothetical protein
VPIGSDTSASMAPIPEPASLALNGIVWSLLLRRKRRLSLGPFRTRVI